MEYIAFNENGLNILFRISDDKAVELVDFSSVAQTEPLHETQPSQFGYRNAHAVLSVQRDDGPVNCMNGYKHSGGSENGRFRYVEHHIEENDYGKLLRIDLVTPEGLCAEYYLQMFTGIRIVRAWARLTNKGSSPIGLNYVSSFYYEGFGKNGDHPAFDKLEFLVPRNSWSNEAQWKHYTTEEAGLSRISIWGQGLDGISNCRFHYGSAGTWSTCEYLPMGMAKDTETGEIYYYQIDFSGPWTIEFGSTIEQHMYIALLGPSDENGWWKNLKPGESFETVPAAFGVALGDESDASGELTLYRRAIRRPMKDAEQANVVFNDYMNCLFTNITEEKEHALIDRSSLLGCEYYCMDAGWYDSGFWWDKVGEWKESEQRFPNGLIRIYEHARAAGMKMGMWLEIESVGAKSPLASMLPDDWFFCRHGKRININNRYFLDFRNPKVREHCRGIIDRLIRDYGCAYFKFDYNIATLLGSDVHSDSPADAVLEHYRAMYGWYEEIYRDYPDLVIEVCASGGQRMDYGLLSLNSLQSVSDQTDYVHLSYITSNISSAVAPEQAAAYAYPYLDEREHVIYNVVSALLLRIYCSGKLLMLSPDSFNLFREGIDVYKSIRGSFTHMLPFFPLGFSHFGDPVLAYGLRNEEKAYLCVMTPGTDTAEIPLKHIPLFRKVKPLYPNTGDCEYTIREDKLLLKMPQPCCARAFVLEL